MFSSMLQTQSIHLLLTSSTLALTLPSIQLLAISPPSTPSLSTVNDTASGLRSITPTLPAPPSNITPDVSWSILPSPVCKGDVLGFDLNQYSCLQSLNTIPGSSTRVEFGDRGHGEFDVKLPRRYSGLDGTCVFDIFHKDGVISDFSSHRDIYVAAERLYKTCVTRGGERPQGGYVSDLGLSKNLVVVMSLYQPSVLCFGPQLRTRVGEQAVQDLLSRIPVTTDRQGFGPAGAPGAPVVVPIIYNTPPNPSRWVHVLKLKIDVEHHDVVNARWFDVWAGAVAVSGRCTVRGYSGVSAVSGGLSVTLMAIPNPGTISQD